MFRSTGFLPEFDNKSLKFSLGVSELHFIKAVFNHQEQASNFTFTNHTARKDFTKINEIYENKSERYNNNL